MSSKTKNAIYPARWIPMDSGTPGVTVDACSVCGRTRAVGHLPGCVGLTHGMAEDEYPSHSHMACAIDGSRYYEAIQRVKSWRDEWLDNQGRLWNALNEALGDFK